MPGSTVIKAAASNNATFYDTLGRNFGVGVRHKW